MAADHEDRPPDVAMEFHKESTAPKDARAVVRPLISTPGDPIAEPVELVTSELVSNVVQHTPDGGTVKAWDPKPDKPFHLEVSDEDPSGRRPTNEVQPSSAPDGRGLQIVDELADDWGVKDREGHEPGDGKTVWADFNRPG